jgi:putative exporter of polyketide antibiotics
MLGSPVARQLIIALGGLDEVAQAFLAVELSFVAVFAAAYGISATRAGVGPGPDGADRRPRHLRLQPAGGRPLGTDISPFPHVPTLPGGEVTAGPLLGLLAAATALTAAGLWALRRRDLAVN